ncbi:hypothetical protein D5R81_14295 [Parashewanella spongiae]|uniref:Porin n=1 Tax=Parashewanella spongiae TaxID=342950 RepID=A0A3A6U3R0_9GAMM|nr:hypothetical protein [Parashewanella spongiae]MCL1079185.1 hypothetical protein [Parashewanella spongiae]RJY10603.1 hypothetical protein D5R81_14295 [Parashewanella spongiae]
MKTLYGLILLAMSTNANALEHELKGIIDLRLTSVDGVDSYFNGGLGKFRFNNDERLSVAQLGLTYQVDWDDFWSMKTVVNGYLDGVVDNVGITELFVNYKGLPFDSGYRIDGRVGLMYPDITLENLATAWASPYTLSYSNINSWLAEEVRHLGTKLSVTRLGKYHQSKHDFNLTSEFFVNNDTTGAMLAWHGWTIGSQQTLWQNTIKTPSTPALDSGGSLEGQAKRSDPFLELDNRIGTHFSAEWNWNGNGKVKAGYYDNNADTRIVKHGQYTWGTRFSHVGIKWRLPLRIELLSQMISGDTLMEAPTGEDAVNIKYSSFNVLLSRRWNTHRFSVRFEDFSVSDRDLTPEDNNNETGNSYTVSYRYQINKGWFIHTEFNFIDSNRPAHEYINAEQNLIERQWQLSSRYFF